MNRPPCLMCGVEGIRQPVIQTKIVTAYVVQPSRGGAKTPRNMFSACKFHRKLWTDWGTDEEKAIALDLILRHMKTVCEDWNLRQCFERREDDIDGV